MKVRGAGGFNVVVRRYDKIFRHTPLMTKDSTRRSVLFEELIRQRVYGLACGYGDCNEATRLSEDPMQRLLLDRDPVNGAIASQPTLSRFENTFNSRSLVKMSCALAETVISRHKKRVKSNLKCITKDMDPADEVCVARTCRGEGVFTII